MKVTWKRHLPSVVVTSDAENEQKKKPHLPSVVGISGAESGKTRNINLIKYKTSEKKVTLNNIEVLNL